MKNLLDKFRIYWSKKENDWVIAYPDRSGKICGRLFFDMFKIEKNIDWIKSETNERSEIVDKKSPDTLQKFLTDKGYDYKTLKITCNKIQPNENLPSNQQ